MERIKWTASISVTRVRHGCRWIACAAAWLLCYGMPAAAQLPPPPVPPQNPITEPKRVLGKMLFWEEQLSSNNTVSCGTCHQPFRAASDFRPAVHPGLDENFNTPDDVFGSFGVARIDETGTPVDDALFGFDRQVTGRSAQTVLNALWSPSTFWDGRAGPSFVNPETGVVSIPNGGGLEAQAVGPILADNEMAHEGRTWNDVTSKLAAVEPMALATYLPADMENALAVNPTYPALFQAAFGSSVITAERIAFAIATYERTLVPNQTRFDLGTLTPQQQQGLNVFQNPGSRCTVCHALPFFTNNTFRNIGIRPIAEDTGRQAVTNNPADAGRFKVPGLRNVGLKATYMHNGRKATLEQVLDFYLGINGQVQFPQNQDPAIAGIAIPPGGARIDLIEFLRNGLTDPRVAAETFPFDRPILKSERGDADRDGDVDATDQASFETCFTGKQGGSVAAGCERHDMEGDGDIDCVDWLGFTQAWTEDNPPTTPKACAGVAVPAVSEWGAAILALTLLTFGSLRLRHVSKIPAA
jgi:cytochrome c peroxidase